MAGLLLGPVTDWTAFIRRPSSSCVAATKRNFENHPSVTGLVLVVLCDPELWPLLIWKEWESGVIQHPAHSHRHFQAGYRCSAHIIQLSSTQEVQMSRSISTPATTCVYSAESRFRKKNKTHTHLVAELTTNTIKHNTGLNQGKYLDMTIHSLQPPRSLYAPAHA